METGAPLLVTLKMLAGPHRAIDVQADVPGSVLIKISVSPTHIQFHFSCFKPWYRADVASLLSDAEISHVYLMIAKQNLL